MNTEVTLPDLGLLAMTRGMLGAGVGLLAADRLASNQRKPLGVALVAVGVLTTIPLALKFFGTRKATPQPSRAKRAARAASPARRTRARSRRA